MVSGFFLSFFMDKSSDYLEKQKLIELVLQDLKTDYPHATIEMAERFVILAEAICQGMIKKFFETV